ncbi:hypothetical protein BKA63DRAFT_494879 [Paraphoma chrysanthemicola]|nr:hypothetical protein BKA63DRAFT_494879 [Paraphoma chrysanthemicola]
MDASRYPAYGRHVCCSSADACFRTYMGTRAVPSDSDVLLKIESRHMLIQRCRCVYNIRTSVTGVYSVSSRHMIYLCSDVISSSYLLCLGQFSNTGTCSVNSDTGGSELSSGVKAGLGVGVLVTITPMGLVAFLLLRAGIVGTGKDAAASSSTPYWSSLTSSGADVLS